MFTSEERRNYIGGSDIAAVMGMSRWKTPLQLWLEKTGDVEPDDLSEVEAVQLGTELEEFVAQKFAKTLNKQVRKQPKMYIHKKYPFMVAHVDRLITGTNEILECKTCASYKADEWEDEIITTEKDGKEVQEVNKKIPIEYLLQVIWYLGITKKKVGYIAVLIGGQKFKYRKIEFDKKLFKIMVDMSVDFWNLVQTKTMPALTPEDNDLMSEVFPTQSEDYIEDQSCEETIQKLQDIKAELKSIELEKKILEAALKNYINSHAGILTDKFKVSWLPESKAYINSDLLKSDNLYDKYSYVKESRTFRIYEKKKKAA